MTTMLGAFTPHCADCGVALCWDISIEEYEESQSYWDRWMCSDCNGFVAYRQSLRKQKGLPKNIDK